LNLDRFVTPVPLVDGDIEPGYQGSARERRCGG
jgi:hypothetical protein